MELHDIMQKDDRDRNYMRYDVVGIENGRIKELMGSTERYDVAKKRKGTTK